MQLFFNNKAFIYKYLAWHCRYLGCKTEGIYTSAMAWCLFSRRQKIRSSPLRFTYLNQSYFALETREPMRIGGTVWAICALTKWVRRGPMCGCEYEIKYGYFYNFGDKNGLLLLFESRINELCHIYISATCSQHCSSILSLKSILMNDFTQSWV